MYPSHIPPNLPPLQPHPPVEMAVPRLLNKNNSGKMGVQINRSTFCDADLSYHTQRSSASCRRRVSLRMTRALSIPLLRWRSVLLRALPYLACAYSPSILPRAALGRHLCTCFSVTCITAMCPIKCSWTTGVALHPAWACRHRFRGWAVPFSHPAARRISIPPTKHHASYPQRPL